MEVLECAKWFVSFGSGQDTQPSWNKGPFLGDLWCTTHPRRILVRKRFLEGKYSCSFFSRAFEHHSFYITVYLLTQQSCNIEIKMFPISNKSTATYVAPSLIIEGFPQK